MRALEARKLALKFRGVFTLKTVNIPRRDNAESLAGLFSQCDIDKDPSPSPPPLDIVGGLAFHLRGETVVLPGFIAVAANL